MPSRKDHKDAYAYERHRLASQLYKYNKEHGTSIRIADILGPSSRDPGLRAAQYAAMAAIRSIRPLAEAVTEVDDSFNSAPDVAGEAEDSSTPVFTPKERDAIWENMMENSHNTRGPGRSIARSMLQELQDNFGYEQVADALANYIKNNVGDSLADVDWYSPQESVNVILGTLNYMKMPEDDYNEWSRYVGEQFEDFVADIKIWR